MRDLSVEEFSKAFKEILKSEEETNKMLRTSLEPVVFNLGNGSTITVECHKAALPDALKEIINE